MDTIQKNTVAIVNYNLHTLTGDIIDEKNQLAYLHGHNNLLWGIEKALQGRQVGENIREEISPEEAFGSKIDEEKLLSVHREQFGQSFERLSIGAAIPIKDSNGLDAFLFVKKLEEEFAFLTRNHPLAGVTLVLQAEVLDIRSGTPEELNDRTAYGIDGSQKPPSCGCC